MKDDTSFLLFKDPLYIFDTEPFEKDKVKTRPLISFKSDSSMQALFDNWLYYHQGTVNPIKKINVDQIETCKQFMMEGIGMAILRSEEHTSELQSRGHLVCRLLLEKKKDR